MKEVSQATENGLPEGAPETVPVPLRRTLMPDTGTEKGTGMSENTFDRSSLGFEAVKLLEILLEHVNEIGRAQVPTSVLLKKSGLTQGALVRGRAELTRQSLLRVEPGFSSSGLRGANVYVLNMLAVEPSSTPSRGDGSLEGNPEEPSGDVPDPEDVSSTRHRKPKRLSWGRLFGSSKGE